MKDIYMAQRKDDTITRVTVEQCDKRYIVESPYIDTDVIEDLLWIIYAIGIAMTYQPETVIAKMRDFVEEHTQEKED